MRSVQLFSFIAKKPRRFTSNLTLVVDGNGDLTGVLRKKFVQCEIALR
jgi:hypothetical protein